MTALVVLYSQIPNTVVRTQWGITGDLGFAPKQIWIEEKTFFDSCEPRTK